MADVNPFTRLLREMQKWNAAILGESSELWGARSARSAIRQSLLNNLSGLQEDDVAPLKDLSEPPRPHDWSVSISHAQELGGWMAVPRPAQIGWDVELKERIKTALIERICSSEEIAEAPHAPHLWCAKEAYFKALEDEQPLVITQLTVTKWQALPGGLWSWQGLGPRNGAGLLLESEPWLVAACLVR